VTLVTSSGSSVFIIVPSTPFALTEVSVEPWLALGGRSSSFSWRSIIAEPTRSDSDNAERGLDLLRAETDVVIHQATRIQIQIQTRLWSKRARSRAERTPQSTLPSSTVNRFKIQSKGGPASAKGRGLSIDSTTSVHVKKMHMSACNEGKSQHRLALEEGLEAIGGRRKVEGVEVQPREDIARH
jgi:hypothetical protein